MGESIGFLFPCTSLLRPSKVQPYADEAFLNLWSGGLATRDFNSSEIRELTLHLNPESCTWDFFDMWNLVSFAVFKRSGKLCATL